MANDILYCRFCSILFRSGGSAATYPKRRVRKGKDRNRYLIKSVFGFSLVSISLFNCVGLSDVGNQYWIIQQRENRDMWSMLPQIITTDLLRSRKAFLRKRYKTLATRKTHPQSRISRLFQPLLRNKEHEKSGQETLHFLLALFCTCMATTYFNLLVDTVFYGSYQKRLLLCWKGQQLSKESTFCSCFYMQ